MSTSLDEALRLAKLGYPVLPCYPNSKKPHADLVPNGLRNASRHPGIITAWFTAEPDANLAVETTGNFVVDVDPVDGGPNPFLEQHDSIESTMTAVSPRGGQHIWYADPTGELRNSSGKVAPSVDIRATGGYVCVYPSVVDGKQYQWTAGPVPKESLPSAPEWLIEKPAPKKERTEGGKFSTHGHGHANRSTIIDRAAKYRDAAGPAYADQGGGKKTFLLAQHLALGFELSDSETFGLLWGPWNDSCDPPWTEAELKHKIKDAIDNGDTVQRGEHLNQPDSSVDISGIVGKTLPVNLPDPIEESAERVQTAKKIQTPDPGPLPKELLVVPGFIGAVMSHNLATAFKQQPELALAAALALQAVLAARKITDERGTMTNLQLLGLCGSGGGKEFGRQLNEKILTLSGQSDLIGPEDIASDSGLLRHVEQHPASLVQLDEIGKFLESLRNPKAGSWLKGIVALLLKFFSKANGSYQGKCYADEDKRVIIHRPCLVVYGTTVKESFVAGLTTEAITDGYLARQLVIEATNDDPDEQFVPSEPVPQYIIDRAIEWRQFSRPGNLISEYPDPVIVPKDAEAQRIMLDLNHRARLRRRDRKGPEATLWTRTVEKANQLALVHAASQGPDNLIIDGPAMRWAADLSWYLTERMAWFAYSYIAENDYESYCLRVARIIREAHADGLTMTELHLKTRWLKTKDRQEILQALKDRGDIVDGIRPTNGRPANTVMSSDFLT